MFMHPEDLEKATEEREADADKRELQDSYCEQGREFMVSYKARTNDLLEDVNSTYRSFDKMRSAWEVLHHNHIEATRSRGSSEKHQRMSIKMKDFSKDIGLPSDHEILD